MVAKGRRDDGWNVERRENCKSEREYEETETLCATATTT